MSKWDSTSVADLVARKVIARPMDGNHGEIHPKADDFVPAGIPFITAADLKGGRLDLGGCKYISEKQARRLRKGFAVEDDVLLSHKATLGRVAMVPKLSVPFVVLTPQVTYYRVLDSSVLDPRFLRFYFESRGFQQALEAHATGSTRGYISISRQSPLPVLIPPLPDQRRIATFLGALDDKIELNRKMNTTLEEMAQAIFKSWFIDFDGHTDLVDSELGPIPRGWRLVSFPEVVDILGGGTPSRSESSYWGEGHKWVSAKDVTGASGLYVTDTAEQITAEGLDRCSTKLCPPGTTVITARGTVGELVMLSEEMCFNQTCYGLVPRNHSWKKIVFLVTRNMVRTLKQQVHGAIFDTITRRTFSSLNFAWPDRDNGNRIEALLSPFFEKSLLNQQQSRTLGELRDTLLPKLISGEIRVPEAEELLEDQIS